MALVADLVQDHPAWTSPAITALMRRPQACMTPHFPAAGPAMALPPRSIPIAPLPKADLQTALTGAQFTRSISPSCA